MMVDLPIDRRFLSGGPAYLTGAAGSSTPAWAFCLVVEKGMGGHRLLCAAIALVGFWGLFLYSLPRFADDSLSGGFLQLDRTLAWYVWGSHLAYANMGPNED